VRDWGRYATFFLVALMAGNALPAGAETSFRALEIDGSPVKWQKPERRGGGMVLRYMVVKRKTETTNAINCGRIRPFSRIVEKSNLPLPIIRDALQRAFAEWQSAADISFKETGDQNSADIIVGEQVDPRGVAYTNLSLEQASEEKIFTPIRQAQICLNPERRYKLGFNGILSVYDLVHVFTHEIGHAIGLDHPGARGELMSFRYLETLQGLSAGDRLGAEKLYGKRGEDRASSRK
jgi:hypothetical protein